MVGNWPTSAFTLVKIPAPQAYVIHAGRFALGIWASMKAISDVLLKPFSFPSQDRVDGAGVTQNDAVA